MNNIANQATNWLDTLQDVKNGGYMTTGNENETTDSPKNSNWNCTISSMEDESYYENFPTPPKLKSDNDQKPISILKIKNCPGISMPPESQ